MENGKQYQVVLSGMEVETISMALIRARTEEDDRAEAAQREMMEARKIANRCKSLEERLWSAVSKIEKENDQWR